jgi:amidase
VKTLPRAAANVYSFDRAVTPCMRVQPGESFVLETQDTAAGQLIRGEQSPFDRVGLDVYPPRVNPVAGPVYIEGVSKGDLLCIVVQRVDVSHTSSVTFTSNRGPLKDSRRWGHVDEPGVQFLEHQVGPSGTMHDGIVRLRSGVEWPAAPFIGTIAVAPERDVVSTVLGQGAFGGNIDCRHVRQGSRIYISAQAEGGLVFVGDLHASQGDMEFTGVAAEAAGVVELSVEVVGRKNLPFPRIETDESLIALAISRPADHALTLGAFAMIEWLTEEHDMSARDAYLQLSVNSLVRAHVYQMLPQMPLNYVVGIEFPKSSRARARRVAREEPA